MLPETPYVLPYDYNIRVTHRNGAIKHEYFRIRSTEGSSADCSLFILLYPCAYVHLALVKILLQIFLYEDKDTCTTHTSVGCISLPECQQDRTLLHDNTIK